MDFRADDLGIDHSPTSDDVAAPSPPPVQSDPAPPPTTTAVEQRPFQDVRTWTWRLFFAAWFALFITFVMIFAVSPEIRFVLGVVASFAAVFFLTPLVLLRASRRSKATTERRYVDLLAGRCSDLEAATQIVLMPIVLTIGLIVIGTFIPR